MEYKINAGQWNALSTEEQEQVTRILLAARVLRDEDSVTPSEATPPFTDQTVITFTNPLVQDGETLTKGWLKTSVCRIACDTVYAIALTATAGLAPAVMTVAIAIATSVHEVCRDAC